MTQTRLRVFLLDDDVGQASREQPPSRVSHTARIWNNLHWEVRETPYYITIRASATRYNIDSRR